MPDGNLVPVPSGVAPQQRSDVSSVERHNMATAHPQEKPLLPKYEAGASGPAQDSSSYQPAYYPPSHAYTSKPPYQHAYPGGAMPARSDWYGGATGKAAEPGGYNPAYPIQTSLPEFMGVPPPKPGGSGGRAPDHERQMPISQRPPVPVAQRPPVLVAQRPPAPVAHHSQLHQQQPASFPQARPYQSPAGPYTVYQQPPQAPAVQQAPPASQTEVSANAMILLIFHVLKDTLILC